MAPSGNGKSASADDGDRDHDSHQSRDGERGENHPVETTAYRDEDGENKSDTSDPIVVSPAGTPPRSSPESVPEEKEEAEEIFEDAKVAPEIPNTPSFIKAGFQRKATPLAIKSWAALLLTLDGRDKITKVCQYVSRLLGWWLAGGPHKNQSIRFTALYKSFAMSRKAFRLGRSFIELENIRSMGLLGLIFWHIQNNLEDNEEGSEKPKCPKTIVRRASSNIGWGPMTYLEEQENRPSLARSLSNVAYQNMYRPLLSRMTSKFASTDKPSVEVWRAFGSVLKMFGLIGFWAGDNVNFLSSSGAFDDYSLPSKERLEKRNRIQSLASKRGAQSYFVASVAGLLTNWYSYVVFRRDKLAKAEEHLKEAVEESLEDQDKTLQLVTLMKQKQFSLFLALLKVCLVPLYSLNLLAPVSDIPFSTFLELLRCHGFQQHAWNRLAQEMERKEK
jgi:hypothetical protein